MSRLPNVLEHLKLIVGGFGCVSLEREKDSKRLKVCVCAQWTNRSWVYWCCPITSFPGDNITLHPCLPNCSLISVCASVVTLHEHHHGLYHVVCCSLVLIPLGIHMACVWGGGGGVHAFVEILHKVKTDDIYFAGVHQAAVFIQREEHFVPIISRIKGQGSEVQWQQHSSTPCSQAWCKCCSGVRCVIVALVWWLFADFRSDQE